MALPSHANPTPKEKGILSQCNQTGNRPIDEKHSFCGVLCIPVSTIHSYSVNYFFHNYINNGNLYLFFVLKLPSSS